MIKFKFSRMIDDSSTHIKGGTIANGAKGKAVKNHGVFVSPAFQSLSFEILKLYSQIDTKIHKTEVVESLLLI